MGKRKSKEFSPEPLTSGARIEWSQFHVNGGFTVRTGTVIDRAPSVDGATVACWVKPDVPLPTDHTWFAMVGKATRHMPAHGKYLDSATGGIQYVGKGELFSSDHCAAPTSSCLVIRRRAA
jgi:hypothetical protein